MATPIVSIQFSSSGYERKERIPFKLSTVMPALVAGIHVFLREQGVDGRDKPGHDGLGWS